MMKFNTISSMMLLIASLSFLWTCVLSMTPRFTCEGGRGEGDKWFDGCRWCVCQMDGPLCSPAGCSNLTPETQPCLKTVKRWSDGCYQCTCMSSGIECKADPSCLVLMQKKHYQRQILSPGACVKPKDQRCICGVDGVPSCTAEVLEGEITPAVAEPLDTNAKTGHEFEVEVPSYFYPKGGQIKSRRNKRSANRWSRTLFGYRSSDYEKAPKKRHHNNDYKKRNHAESEEEAREVDDEFIRLLRAGRDEEHFDHFESREEVPVPDINLARRKADDSPTLMPAPISLFIVTSNRCRFGTRWYAGSLRCVCDDSLSVICGDPSFVAPKVDGFSLENKACEEGHAWTDTCRVCSCETNGVVLCQRGNLCPLPFQIVAVNQQNVRDIKDYPDEENIPDDDRKMVDRRAGGRWTRTHRLPISEDDYRRAMEELEPSNNAQSPPMIIKDKDCDNKDTKGTRGVYTRHRYRWKKKQRCNPWSRWMQGCLRCTCDSSGKSHCDDSKCLKAMKHTKQFCKGRNCKSSGMGRNNRPYQRPPKYRSRTRTRPISRKPLFPKKNPCGRFKVGQMYYVKCNRCKCMPQGPKCTAMNCV